MTFHHMSGAGNCFLVADAQNDATVLSPEHVLRVIAQHPRHDGRSIEGVLLLRECKDNIVRGDFYNPDGTHGMMCGNGARCLIRFACDHGLGERNNIELQLNNMSFTAHVVDQDHVSIEFPPPREITFFPAGRLSDVDVDVWYVNVGSDHAVIDGPLHEHRPIVHTLRSHHVFPRGVNVNMVDVANGGMRIATFERGVEAITGACGTGALSCAVVQWMKNRELTKFTLTPPSGRELQVQLHINNGAITGMTLTGDAIYDNT